MEPSILLPEISRKFLKRNPESLSVEASASGEDSDHKIPEASRLIFSGAGAFTAGMGFSDSEWVCCSEHPFSGICLERQLLFILFDIIGILHSLPGIVIFRLIFKLKLIPGVVGCFDSSLGYKVPQIGWHALQIKKNSETSDDVGCQHVYFFHSYRAMPSNADNEWISSTCSYGDDFSESIKRGNVHAVQFHPGKKWRQVIFLYIQYSVPLGFSFFLSYVKIYYASSWDNIQNDCFSLSDVGFSILKRFLHSNSSTAKLRIRACRPTQGNTSKLCQKSNCSKPAMMFLPLCISLYLVIACLDVRKNDKGERVVTGGDQYDVREQPRKMSILFLGDLPMSKVLRLTSENAFLPLTAGGGTRDFTDFNGRLYNRLAVASEYFRYCAHKISIGSYAVYAAEEYIRTGVRVILPPYHIYRRRDQIS
ncbi:hypothetical protein MKX03_032361 [Papaver bracteatum]|nr:hypothetical protein MKX03_032361 [Papaver bracteatum]